MSEVEVRGVLAWTLLMLMLTSLRKKNVLSDTDLTEMIEVMYAAIEVRVPSNHRDAMLEELYEFDTSLRKVIEYEPPTN